MNNLQSIFQTVNELFEKEQFIFEPEQLYAPIDYTLRLGGKRLRPTLLLATNQMMGGDLRQATDAAIGIEIFHNFTLLHDDVMDRSPLRRGQATVWTRWNENTAILSGDTMFAVAWRYFLKQPLPNLLTILNCFNETAIEVCEGQQFDMNFESQSSIPIDDYMMMIRKKTAVLLAGAMKLGGLYANANPLDLDHLYRCGIAMGLAFQIQDDLLDAYGDATTFGKPTAQDIRDHKKTYIILKAVELTDHDQRQKLIKLYNTPTHTDDTIAQILDIYRQLNVKQLTEERISQLLTQAESELANIAVPEENKQPLQDIITKLVGRKR